MARTTALKLITPTGTSKATTKNRVLLVCYWSTLGETPNRGDISAIKSAVLTLG